MFVVATRNAEMFAYLQKNSYNQTQRCIFFSIQFPAIYFHFEKYIKLDLRNSLTNEMSIV